MATPKSEKKKKGSPASKRAKFETKKKITPKARKEMVKKTVKPLIKPEETAKSAPPKDGHEPTRRLLLDMRKKLMAESSESRIPEPLAAPSDIGDLIDQAGDERDRELYLLLTGREKEKLLAINEALEKVDEGTYGICEECGEKIGAGRLKVMPLAKFCVNCQSGLEKETSLQRKEEEEMKYRGLAFSPGAEEEES